MYGTFYCVGVGPGDPSLLTLKAVDVIRSCDVLASPDTGRNENTALNIVREYTGGKEILMCHTPMTRDQDVLSTSYKKNADLICGRLSVGQDVCFITLGDPSIYSTVTYIYRQVVERGFEIEIIPGVPSFCAVAAALKLPLCEGATPLHIIPASYDGLDMGLSLKGAKVLMKSGKQLKEAVAALERHNLISRAKMVSRCTMSDEKIYEDLSCGEITDEYFATIVVGEDTE